MLDFGLAKLREGADLNDVTSQGAIVGTPYFMAPEQIRGEPVDPRTDIYALGALMYRALTGHYPFNGPDADGGVHQAPHRGARPARRARAPSSTSRPA